MNRTPVNPKEPATAAGLPTQVIAIDWSGAQAPAAQRRGLRVATCAVADSEAALLPGRLRAEVEAWLAELGRAQAPVVAGLDFSFSLPAWFLAELGLGSAEGLWAAAAEQGEQWLRAPHPHFWGRRKGSGPPPTHRGPAWLGYRACERSVLPGLRLPLSSFQIGGAGAVGTGTLRGMPMLTRLRAAGWSIWPFDPPLLPLLVEIYPRALTGPVVKSSHAARAAYLARAEYRTLTPATRAEAEASEDAFDALVSVLAMRACAGQFAGLRQAVDNTERLEGAIWLPARS